MLTEVWESITLQSALLNPRWWSRSEKSMIRHIGFLVSSHSLVRGTSNTRVLSKNAIKIHQVRRKPKKYQVRITKITSGTEIIPNTENTNLIERLILAHFLAWNQSTGLKTRFRKRGRKGIIITLRFTSYTKVIPNLTKRTLGIWAHRRPMCYHKAPKKRFSIK